MEWEERGEPHLGKSCLWKDVGYWQVSLIKGMKKKKYSTFIKKGRL
jgi:hypothetical protein